MSNDPLREYCDVLRMISLSPNLSIDVDSKINAVKVKDLIDQGGLNALDVSTIHDSSYSFQDVSITPQGAVMLAEWSQILERASFKFKFMSILERFIWVIIGIGSTFVSEVSKYLFSVQ